MGKIVTQKRVDPGFRELSAKFSDGYNFPQAYSTHRMLDRSGYMVKIPVQETTSYRSGSTEFDDPIGSTYTPDDQQALHKMLSEDRKKTKSQRAGDTGHEFSTFRQTYTADVPHTRLRVHRYGRLYEYEGVLLPTPRFCTYGYPDADYSVPAVPWDYFGPKVIRDTIPTKSVSNLLAALIELRREGMPSLPGLQSFRNGGATPGNLGGEYLNYEFGFKPLANEIAKTMFAVTESSKLIRQYEKDSGKIVRRKRLLEDEVVLHSYTFSRDTTAGGYSLANRDARGDSSPFYQMFMDSPQRVTQTVLITRSTWFSGAFSYYYKEANSSGESILGKMREFEMKANRLLGTRITPEVLWEVAPWSWLSDWFVNMGDNIANAQALSQDGLVIRWGYLMSRVTKRHTLTAEGAVLADGQRVPPCSVTWTEVSKERRKASPFGFGKNPADFTNRQWAILTALSMTRGEKTLRQAS